MAEKASFRDAFRSSRCLLLIDGFYEWKSLGGGKQPYFVRRVDEAPMALAGLYSVFGREQVLWTCAAVTLAARGGMLALHERMPAVLDAEGQQRWLDEASAFDAASLFALLERGDGAGGMDVERVPVSSWVNDVRHEGPRCIQPVEIARQQLLFD
jgi:putative SOS response-associated peptidase YedK